MKTLPVLPGQAASSRPSPVEIWQILLSRLLDQHYGLTLNDTPFADERVIEQHIEAGISLCDAVNFLVEAAHEKRESVSNKIRKLKTFALQLRQLFYVCQFRLHLYVLKIFTSSRI